MSTTGRSSRHSLPSSLLARPRPSASSSHDTPQQVKCDSDMQETTGDKHSEPQATAAEEAKGENELLLTKGGVGAGSSGGPRFSLREVQERKQELGKQQLEVLEGVI